MFSIGNEDERSSDSAGIAWGEGARPIWGKGNGDEIFSEATGLAWGEGVRPQGEAWGARQLQCVLIAHTSFDISENIV